ncbi:hypothetical protein TWF730_004957 [Orbilia blumenaviensis]|uniref:Uncharacterized protein n=1 Tax=Orbilia blumenaviensis TaxID=1796055 RepID=A0AAV9VGT0_9PEZI
MATVISTAIETTLIVIETPTTTVTTYTRNVLGPLTTAFTADPSCTIPAIYCPQEGNCYGWKAQTCINGAVDQSFCWPPWTAGAATSTTPEALRGWGLYSPGLVCPHGHTMACSTTFGGEGNFQFQFPATVGETAVGCCPSGYFCQRTNVAQTCVFTATSITLEAVVCSDLLRSPTEFIIPTTFTTDTDETSTEVVTISTQTLFAPLFQLNWREVDLPKTSSSSSSTAGGLNAPTGGSSSGSDKAVNNDGGLSVAAKAGIGAGVGVLVLLIIGALIWFWKSRARRRDASQRGDGLGYDNMPFIPPPIELHQEPKMPVHEASAERIHSELPTAQFPPQAQVWELESRTTVVATQVPRQTGHIPPYN